MTLQFSYSALLMAFCSFVLAGLQGKYAFYAVLPVAMTFGKISFLFVLRSDQLRRWCVDSVSMCVNVLVSECECLSVSSLYLNFT